MFFYIYIYICRCSPLELADLGVLIRRLNGDGGRTVLYIYVYQTIFFTDNYIVGIGLNSVMNYVCWIELCYDACAIVFNIYYYYYYIVKRIKFGGRRLTIICTMCKLRILAHDEERTLVHKIYLVSVVCV